MVATLEVRHLSLTADLRGGQSATVLDDVSFEIEAGGALGLVGESGSGKTLTGLAIMGLLPPGIRVTAGQILLEGEDLLCKSQRQMQKIRGESIAMVLQDPMTALDPSFTIRSQVAEPLREHRHLAGAALSAAVVDSLEQVNLSAARERLSQYPHQLSGGMRQRVTSAAALASGPRLLIADEPTTALDVTTQARYLQMLHDLQEATGFALLLVTHDLFVVRHVCQRVAVMYAAQILEQGPVEDVFSSPQHPYSHALLKTIPVFDQAVSLESIEGQAPHVGEHLSGCRFAPRCKFAHDVCGSAAVPELSPRGAHRLARCRGTEQEGWIEW